MNGNNGASQATNGDGHPTARDETAAEAQRLFADLLAQPPARRNGARSTPPPQAVAEPTAAPAAPAAGLPLAPPSGAELRRPRLQPSDAELRRMALAVIAATAPAPREVGVGRSPVDADAAALADLGRAIEEALIVTNERMAALERVVLGAPAPPAGSAHVMARLRARVRRVSEGPTGNGTL